MKDNVRYNLPLAIGAGLLLLLLVGVLTFAGPCTHEDGTLAACSTAGQATSIAAALGLALSVVALAVRNRKVSGALALAAAIAAIFAAIAPGTVFPLCMMRSMHCWAVMQPYSLVMGVAAAILCLVGAVRILRIARK